MGWCCLVVCNDSQKRSVACWIVTLFLMLLKLQHSTTQLRITIYVTISGAYLIYDKAMYIMFMFAVLYLTHVKIISMCLCTASHLSFQAVYRNDILSGVVGHVT